MINASRLGPAAALRLVAGAGKDMGWSPAGGVRSILKATDEEIGFYRQLTPRGRSSTA
jgi:hypothetical protein